MIMFDVMVSYHKCLIYFHPPNHFLLKMFTSMFLLSILDYYFWVKFTFLLTEKYYDVSVVCDCIDHFIID